MDSIEYSSAGSDIGSNWEFTINYSSNAPSPITTNENDYNGTKTLTQTLNYGQTAQVGLTVIDAAAGSPYTDAFWPINLKIFAKEKDLIKDDHGTGEGSIIAALDTKTFENTTSININVQEYNITGNGPKGVLIAHFTLISTPTSNEDFEGDRFLSIYYRLVAKAWKDADLKQQLLTDPIPLLKENGVNVPAGITIKVLEDAENIKYLNLTRDLDVGKNGFGLSKLIEKILPIKEGSEIRLVQSNENTRYLIFPRTPANVSQQPSAEANTAFAADSGVEATFHDTTALTEVEQTEVTVTTTTAVQDAEAATTAAAVAEVVAVAAAVLT